MCSTPGRNGVVYTGPMDEAQRVRNDEIARKLGKSVGRFRKAARAAAKSMQPEAERLARQARPAAARASQFVRDHEGEIRRVAGTSARMAAYRSAPPMLRPVIVTVAEEISRGSSRQTKRPPGKSNEASANE